MRRLEGKVAVITGGNSGIGLATAKRFQDEGARVAISGRSQKTLDEASQLLGKNLLAVQADTAKPADIDKLIAAVKEKFGRIDVLFVNAGVAKFGPIENANETFYDEMFDINTKGAYFTVQKALPLMSQGGSIIFNTSVASHIGAAGGTVYAATKAAMRSFTRSMAAELVDRGIRVNAIAPGPIETPILGRTNLSKEQSDNFVKGLIASVPMKRFGTSEEVAGAVAFLASSDASFITGVELDVDGGKGNI